MLIGLSGTDIEDILRARNARFKEMTVVTNDKFDMAEGSPRPFEYTGFALSCSNAGDVVIDKHQYLECIPLHFSLNRFRSMGMKLAWLANSRPDSSFKIAKLA